MRYIDSPSVRIVYTHSVCSPPPEIEGETIIIYLPLLTTPCIRRAGHQPSEVTAGRPPHAAHSTIQIRVETKGAEGRSAVSCSPRLPREPARYPRRASGAREASLARPRAPEIAAGRAAYFPPRHQPPWVFHLAAVLRSSFLTFFLRFFLGKLISLANWAWILGN